MSDAAVSSKASTWQQCEYGGTGEPEEALNLLMVDSRIHAVAKLY